MTTWISGGHVFDVRTGRFRRLDLAVEGERIADLVEPGDPSHHDTVIQADGAYLLPGLIDCHVHLTIRSEDADPAAGASRPDAAMAAYAAGAAERTLTAGITTVRDVGGWNYVEMALREAIDEGLRAGPRLFLAGRLLSITTPAIDYYPGMYEEANGADEVKAAVRKQFSHGADLIKVMATGAMLSPESEDAGATQFTLEELRAAVQTAEDDGRHVAAHAHARQGIANAVEAGVSSIEHGTFADEDVLRAMAEKDTFMVATMSASAVASEDDVTMAAMPAHLRRRFEESARIHLEAMRLAHRLGVPFAMGTDAGTPGNHHGANAMECVHLVEDVGMTPQESIRAATANAARLLRREGELGALEPGKLADVIACREDPLTDIRALTRVALVMKGGAPVRASAGG